MSGHRVEYDIRLRLVRRPRGDDLADFNRLRSALIKWIVAHADEGEITMMSAGPPQETDDEFFDRLARLESAR